MANLVEVIANIYGEDKEMLELGRNAKKGFEGGSESSRVFELGPGEG